MLSQIALAGCIFLVVLVIVGILSGVNTFTRYLAIAFDAFWNVVTGGSLDMTISARTYIKVTTGSGGIWKLLYKTLNALQANHCELAVQGDADRAKAVLAALAPYDTRNKKG